MTGAPGCGKACFFWLWANIKLLQHQGKECFTIHSLHQTMCNLGVEGGGCHEAADLSGLYKASNLVSTLNDLFSGTNLGCWHFAMVLRNMTDDVTCEDLMEERNVHYNDPERR
jgi:hypothetical protein